MGYGLTAERGATRGQRLKVLFVGASGRSGSTIVGNVLGEMSGFFHAGELRTLWGRGLIGGRLCGCGLPVGECDFWTAVLALTLRDADGNSLDPREVNRLHEASVHLRYLPRMLRQPHGSAPDFPALKNYGATAERLYLAIGEVTGARVIVDSSKQPADAAVLRFLPNLDPYFLHLVRDPRAVAYSWQRRKTSPGEGSRQEMMRLGPMTSSRNWMVVNLAVEALRRRESASRSRLVRYESFIADPRRTVARILDLLSEEHQEMAFIDDHLVHLTPGHTAGGNPDRFRTGATVLREDREWREKQRFSDRSVSTAITLPLLGRYGYPVFAGSRSRSRYEARSPPIQPIQDRQAGSHGRRIERLCALATARSERPAQLRDRPAAAGSPSRPRECHPPGTAGPLPPRPGDP